MKTSIILTSDSYKYSMPFQYPEGTEYVYSYIESRGGEWDKTVFFGLQYFIKEYLMKPITKEDIDLAEKIITKHGEPFYRAGWEHILNFHNGKLPLVIRAVPEGTVVPTKNVLLTIENTDPKCWWLTTFVETALLRAIWYPTTVATNSLISKEIIMEYLVKSGTPDNISFMLHDFGAHGVSSLESSGIGGAAHLCIFKGTDNIAALVTASEYYSANMAGFSVPAMEHSTVTSWGRENEVESYRNMIRKFKNGIVSIVSDSYDIYNACEMFGTVLKDEIIENNVTLVVRPDSGDARIVVPKCLEILETYFGSKLNQKGYKVLNHVKVLQGDGINHHTIKGILVAITASGFSADNVLFGQGGALLQQIDRDTQRFAMKCSSVCVNGRWRDVYKDPITDKGKSSKKGLVDLLKDENGTFYSGLVGDGDSELVTVFIDGELICDYSFEQIRNNVLKSA